MTPRTLSQQDCADVLLHAAYDDIDTAIAEAKDALRLARSTIDPARQGEALLALLAAAKRMKSATLDALIAIPEPIDPEATVRSMLAASVERLAEGAR